MDIPATFEQMGQLLEIGQQGVETIVVLLK
jgi:hypothetical protein